MFSQKLQINIIDIVCYLSRMLCIYLFLSCCFVMVHCQNATTEDATVDNYEDAINVFEIFPCNDTQIIVEVFDKQHPEYYNLLIVTENIPFFPKKVNFKLDFDNLTHFQQNYEPALYSTNSYFLNVLLLKDDKKNISIFVSPLQGKGHPFPNLISAVINNETFCKESHVKGFWDRFITVEPLYSAVNDNSSSTIDEDKELIPNISTKSKFKDVQCGQVVKQHKELIHHGEPVTPGTWPWHAALYKIKTVKGELKYICGGTLISKTRVVTAGHCVIEQGSVILPERLSVVLGKINFVGGDFGNQEKGVFDIILHPEFSAETLDNDIAILKLSSEAKFTEYVQPICLWEGSATRTTIFGEYGYIVGWGATQTSTYSLNLKQSRLPVRSDLECVKNNPSFFGKFLDENSFCAGYINGTAACNGDSGGGFFMQRRGTWYLRGIISLGVSRQDHTQCDPDYYTIFTDVAQHMDFIQAVGGLL